MKKSLLSNIPLKLMSVLVAVVVWLLVVNVDDPIKPRNISGVVVTVQNEAYIESSGQMCLIPENQDVISVKVTGKRSVVDKIKAEDIVAVADMTQIISLKTDPIMVPISVSCPGIQASDIQPIPQNMSISLDDKMSLEFLITASTGSAQPGKGYELGSLQVNPEKVKITGPKSLMQKIDKVIANVEDDVQDMTSDKTIQDVALRIIDKNQEAMEDRQTRYLKYEPTSPTVDVDVKLWRVKNDVKLKAGYVGEPEEGYKVDKITLTPDTISLAGSDEALAELNANGNTIEIPAENIDVSGAAEDFEVRINIQDLLPAESKLTKDTSDTILAHVSVLPQDSKEYSVSTKNLQALNVPEGMQVVPGTDSILVRVREGTRDLENLDSDDIKASIDCSGRSEGTYTLPVDISLPVGYELVDSVSTSVTLSTVETESTNNE